MSFNMKSAIILFASAAVLCFLKPACNAEEDMDGDDCVENLMECMMNSTTAEEYRSTEMACCELSLADTNNSFSMAFDTCFQEAYTDVILSCINSSESDCPKTLPEMFSKCKEAYEEFNSNVTQIAMLPVDAQDCTRFVTDYEAATLSLCQANTDERLKEMCDTVISFYSS